MSDITTPPSIAEKLAKEITAQRVIFLAVISLVFFGSAASRTWNSKADASSLRAAEVRIAVLERTNSLESATVGLRLTNLERSSQWTMDTLWQQARRDGLPVLPPPKPTVIAIPVPIPSPSTVTP